MNLERDKLIVRSSVAVIVVSALLTAAAGYFAATQLKVNTDTEDLLSESLPFRQAMARYRELFPQNEQQFVLVVEAATPEAAEAAADRLAEAVRARDELFAHVHQPFAGPYFERHGLLFRTPEALEATADRLRRSQQLIAQLRANPTVEGLFTTLGAALRFSPESGRRLSGLMDRMSRVVGAQLEGEPDELSWRLALGGPPPGGEREPPYRSVLIAQPHVDYAKVMAADAAIAAVESISGELGFGEPGEPQVRVTGRVVLSNAELETVLGGMAIGGPVALLLVTLVLYFGLRSSRLVISTLVTLVAGLILTAGFGTLVVGRLNLISMAFAMLYVGLGVDFAIHFNLRFRTQRRRGEPHLSALSTTGRTTGKTLALCAVTTSIGFFAFVPTSFAGVKELGIIAGGGMLISFVVTLTLLPALLALLDTRTPPIPVARGVSSRLLSRIMHVPEHHRRPVIVAAATIILGGAFALPFVRFNTDPLDLRRQNSEAVRTLKELRAEGGAAHWTVTVLADGRDEAERLMHELVAEGPVDRVVNVFDLIPKGQERKLPIIESLRADLEGGEALAIELGEPASAEATLGAVRTLMGAIDRWLGLDDHGEAGEQVRGFRSALAAWVERFEQADAAGRDAMSGGLHDRLLSNLPLAMASLRTALGAGPVSLETMPEGVKRRWVSREGVYRLQVMPGLALESDLLRRRFVESVQSVVPSATGAPVIEVAASRTVISAFQWASIYAIAGIIVVLLIQMRSVRLAASVLLPMIMAAMLTAVGMVLFGIPFNFANVIALPLLLGIGVDHGIHMVHRARRARTLGVALLETSTARAVLYSTLTTLVSFGSLAFSPHPGTASMGQVLSMGLILILIATLVLVPALVRPSELTMPEEDLPAPPDNGLITE